MANSIPSLDQVLAHLNKLRLNNTAIGFILNEKLLQMLRKVHQKCAAAKKTRRPNDDDDDENDQDKDDDDDEDNDTRSDEENMSLRKRYADLFSLALDENESGSSQQPSQRETNTSRAAATAAVVAAEGDEDDEDGDDNDDDENDEGSRKAKSTARRPSGKRILLKH